MEMTKEMVKLMEFGEMQMMKQNNDEAFDFIYLEDERFEDIGIVNPFVDDTGRNDVNPQEFYGNAWEVWKEQALKVINK